MVDLPLNGGMERHLPMREVQVFIQGSAAYLLTVPTYMYKSINMLEIATERLDRSFKVSPSYNGGVGKPSSTRLER